MNESPAGQPTPPRIRRSQTVALSLLMISGVINYLDRGTLAVANESIRADLGLSLGQMGILLSAFSWSYALCQLPVGALVDRVGPRWLLGIGLIVWSLAQAAGGLAATFGYFVVTRIVLGIGEAPQFPSAARVVSNWFPLRSRGTPTGIFNAASPLGIALAPLCLSILIASTSWHWAFIVTGAAGFLVSIVWLMVYRDPVRSQMTDVERQYLDADADQDSANKAAGKLTFADWRALFSYGTTWGMLIGFFGSVYLNWVYLTWLPGYLRTARHMSLQLSGVAAAVPFFCGFIGALLAGWLSDLITRRSNSAVAGRRNAVVITMLGGRAGREQYDRPRLHLGRDLSGKRCFRLFVVARHRGSTAQPHWFARCDPELWRFSWRGAGTGRDRVHRPGFVVRACFADRGRHRTRWRNGVPCSGPQTDSRA